MFREFLSHLSLELYRSPHTVDGYATDLRGFNDFLLQSGVSTDDAGFFMPSAVSQADIRQWVASLVDSGLKPSSVRRKMQSVKSYFKFLVKTGILEKNPAVDLPLPKKPQRLPEVTTPDNVLEVAELEAGARNRLIFEMLYGCGLRRAELAAITDRDINIHSRELRIIGKGSKTRILPLPHRLLEHIKEWQHERDIIYPGLPEPRPLIATARGAMSESMLYKIVRKGLQGTTASKKSPHTLRHTFATSLLNGGADINSVKELLGHSSLSATQIYTHVAFEDLKKDWDSAHPRSRAKSTEATPEISQEEER